MTDPAPLHDRARLLRINQTGPERTLWSHLRARQLGNLKFRRRHPIGPFIADFCCVERALVIELDGEPQEMCETQDAERTAFLEARGFRVIRFSNFEVQDGKLRDDAVGEAGYVVGHYQKIARVAFAILYPVGEDRFDLEAQMLEGGARGCLIRRHLGRQLFEAEPARDLEDLRSETAAEPQSAIF
jgi:very-short-patch-repair endonuclease